MFYVNNLPILADELEVLQTLKNSLAAVGIERFHKFIQTTNHIQFNCPFHKGGQERKPSCGITTTQIIKVEGNERRTISSGTVHCFQCGWTGSLEEMISNCFGQDDGGIYGAKWLLQHFLTVEIEQRQEIQIDCTRNTLSTIKPKITYITEEELDTYRYTVPYMYQRRLTDEIIEKFDVGYDNNFTLVTEQGKTVANLQCVTFPVKDLSGNVLFIARRCIHNKLFHYPSGVTKPVYGLYELQKYAPNCTEVYICESIFNALTCWVYGKPAVALNGTGTPYQYKQLANLSCRKFVLALDPDAAGDKGCAKLKDYFMEKKLLSRLILPAGKDVNDLSFEEFNSLEQHITF